MLCQKEVCFKNEDKNSPVRRVKVNYETQMITVYVLDVKGKSMDVFCKPEADTFIMKRFFESPRMYKHLGFMARELVGEDEEETEDG